MADPRKTSDPADQAGSPSAPGSPDDKKGPAEIAPDTAEKDNIAEKQGNQNDDEEEQQSEKEDDEEGKELEKEGECETEEAFAPPLPDEELPPPLPNEVPPGEDDGWEPVWDANAQAYYFYNCFTGISQWENPRVPTSGPSAAAANADAQEPPQPQREVSPMVGGYNPAIHGDYDPTAPYAQQYEQQRAAGDAPAIAQAGGSSNTGYPYEAMGQFNRFTGKWQAASLQPENYNDENKSWRQMNAFFDVDSVANSHDGRSLRAERSAKKLSKKELKAFKDKRREKKEEKRRAWLRD